MRLGWWKWTTFSHMSLSPASAGPLSKASQINANLFEKTKGWGRQWWPLRQEGKVLRGRCCPEVPHGLTQPLLAGLYLVSTVCPVVLWAGLCNCTDQLQLLDWRPVAQPLKASVALSVKWR